MGLNLDLGLRIGSLVVSVCSFGFAVFQRRKRVRLHGEVSAFLHGLKAAAEIAQVQPIVVQINDRLTKLKMNS
jgi:hypothetical protein